MKTYSYFHMKKEENRKEKKSNRTFGAWEHLSFKKKRQFFFKKKKVFGSKLELVNYNFSHSWSNGRACGVRGREGRGRYAVLFGRINVFWANS